MQDPTAPAIASRNSARPTEGKPETFGLLLPPNFTMFGVTCVVDPLRVANRLSGKTLYDWITISVDGGVVEAGNRFRVQPDASIHNAPPLDNLVVCNGYNGHLYKDPEIVAWLRRLDRHGTRLGAVSTGSWILAYAGLLDGHRCTVHWEDLTAFEAAYPQLEATADLFEIDKRRFTCSGGTASLDMMLHLIALKTGYSFAMEVAEQLMHYRMRESHERQRLKTRERLAMADPRLVAAVELMESELEEPLALAEIARRAGISRRQLERLFGSFFAKSPLEYYRNLRLHKSRRLLTQTAMSVLEIAIACGFRSSSHFTQQYRGFFGRTPSEDRKLRSQFPIFAPAGDDSAPGGRRRSSAGTLSG